ncbi:MAG: hypothetical protein PSU94_03910 [Lacunisphaera sp.]|nr:hypothetical protein [Lacunisphaera sp.]
MSLRPFVSRGSVVLIALCFVAVLGIALASYVGVCSRAMQLSNRGAQTGASAQLAEMGLSEALRAFNARSWSTWTVNGTTATWSTSGTTASCTITFPSTKFGQGMTGSVKIRVDNYDANQLNATWNSSTTYRINDLVGYNGIWYRCLTANTAYAPPNLKYWAEAPIPWKWSSDITYAQYDVVNYNGTWYRCLLAHTNQTPTTNAYWCYIPSMSLSWSSSNIVYPLSTMLFDSGIWYYCIKAHTSSGSITPSNTTYWAAVLTASGTQAPCTAATNYYIGVNFAVGDYIYCPADSIWYRCIQAGTNVSVDYADTTKWVANSIPYISWGWRSGISYAYNSVVHYSASGSGTWYRCITAGASTPTTASWENALSGSWAWSSSTTYNLNDVVYRSGSFYQCIQSHTNQAPPNATYWSTDPLLSPVWDSARSYGSYDTVSYNGAWYLSLQAGNLGQNPATKTDWWALAPQSLATWDSTKTYSLNDTVSYSGTWYRCIYAHSNQTPTNATYWVSTTGASYLWNSATAYTTSSYVCYGGIWYHCISSNTNVTPNKSTYWTALGAPVIYAEGVATLPDGTATIKTQLRATVAPAPLFPNALGATTLVNLASTGTIDSYDSALGTYNTTPSGFGSANIGSAAVVAGGTNASNAVTLTSIRLNGYVAAPSAATTPFAPVWTYGGSAILTSVAAPTAPSANIDLTRVSRSPYIPQFDIQTVVGGTALTLTAGANTNIGTPGATTPSRYVISGDLTLNQNGSNLTILGPVILDVQGQIWIYNQSSPVTSSCKIIIKSTGSAEIHISGRLYVGSSISSGGGNYDGIQNLTLDPKKCILIGTSTANTSGSHYYWSLLPFYGVIYMPSAYVSTWNNVPIYGAVSAKNIVFPNAGSALHYDTSLRAATFSGADAPYIISEWRELTDATEKITLP